MALETPLNQSFKATFLLFSSGMKEERPHPPTLFARWHGTPLYLRILAGCVVGAVVGATIPPLSGLLTRLFPDYPWPAATLVLPLEIPSKLVLRLLGALATPLVFAAIVQALMHAQLPKGSALRLVSLLALNTLVAILIGLLVANVLRPGKWAKLPEQETTQQNAVDEKAEPAAGPDPLHQFLDNVPKSILGPFADEGKVLSVIMLAVAFGIALRRLKTRPTATVADIVEVGFQSLLTLLHWIIEVIPLAVMGIVASILATKGIRDFLALGGFVLAVIVGLVLQTVYYLVRIRFWSWCQPLDVLRGMRDALVMAFSTGSSTATMPVTYACLREKVGLRERSASLGALVGANFNNDGTALYEAMSALFISQLLGQDLSLMQQALVIVTSVIASVGAAGIPEAGIVTMTLVFTAVGLPTDRIPMLLTVDWFLDRCRTTVNVLGDVNVSCLLDGQEREVVPENVALLEDAPSEEEEEEVQPAAK
jgi:DAACS family dicarboxylate/amino acid:cation (Na+ or H+) symporter